MARYEFVRGIVSTCNSVPGRFFIPEIHYSWLVSLRFIPEGVFGLGGSLNGR